MNPSGLMTFSKLIMDFELLSQQEENTKKASLL